MRLALLFVFACGSNPAPVPVTPVSGSGSGSGTGTIAAPIPPAPPAIAVAMSRRGGGEVAAGATIKTGDLVELSVTPNQAGYVYVVQFFADGTYDLLFPSSGIAVQATAGQRVRVPQNPKGWLKVSGDAGEEHVHVLFTTAPLATISPALANGLGLAVDARAKPVVTPPPPTVTPPPDPPKPPPTANRATRTYTTKAGSSSKKPLVMTYDRGSKSLQEIVIDDEPVAFTPASGIIVQTFWYVHAP